MKSVNGKQLYTITVTTEVLIAADTMGDALRWAEDHMMEIQEDTGERELDAVVTTVLPEGWDDDCMVYGYSDEEHYVEEFLDNN